LDAAFFVEIMTDTAKKQPEYPNRLEALRHYREVLAGTEKGDKDSILEFRNLCLNDLYFLLIEALGQAHMVKNKPRYGKIWLWERCWDVVRDPNGYMDLWSREHFKTTIITFGLTIQEILHNPEITIGIFSFNVGLANDIVFQIKEELQTNQRLKYIFQDVLYLDPEKESPKWTEKEGFIVRRKGKPREKTVQGFGLVDAMPTGRHYLIRVYDDIITEKYVTNEEQVKKAVKAWELSLNLGSQDPVPRYGVANIARYIGTRYGQNDPYEEMLERGKIIERKHPATHDGTFAGKPVLFTQELLEDKIDEMGEDVASSQLLQAPWVDKTLGFDTKWLCYINDSTFRRNNWWHNFNRYLICDPAGEKKKTNDYTVIVVIGLGEDQNYYLIDGVRDRLGLDERTEKIFEFHRRYRPVLTGYEKYGKESDLEAIEKEMEGVNYRFKIIPLSGNLPKKDRIRKLQPICKKSRFWLPPFMRFKDYQGKQRDFTQEFIKYEFSKFPNSRHDDMLDCISRIIDQQECNTKNGWRPVFPDPNEQGNILTVQQAEKYNVLGFCDTQADEGYDPLNYMNAG
jgi:predicted phage terminase large subunit-like protein